MRICSNCNTVLDPDDIFCPSCGTKYEEPEGLFCQECGFELDEDDDFCMNCGAPVRIRPAATDQDNSEIKATDHVSKKGRNLKAAIGAAGAVYDNAKAGSYSAPDRSAEDTDMIVVPDKTSFYLVDFAKSLVRSHKVPVIIYLVLNIIVIWGVFFAMLGGNALTSFLGAMACYTVSVAIALSPIGETLLRWQTGCKKIMRKEISAKIEPLFNEAMKRARIQAAREGLSIPEDVQLFINDDEVPNAFATGRKTICCTKGLLSLPDDQIIATFCHEFGHITHHDTDCILLITVGNMMVTFIITAIKVCTVIASMLTSLMMIFFGGKEGLIGGLLTAFSSWLTIAVVNFLMWAWTQLGNLLVMKTMRGEEYKADEFAYYCGYGNSLCALLDALSVGTEKESGLFATLMSTHPDSDSRVAALQELGATYQATF